jgi:adenylate cyclase
LRRSVPAWLLLFWRRGLREAVLAVTVAMGVLLVTQFHHFTLLRGLETSSLDLRFRLRGVLTPRSKIAVVLVDDDSLAQLGRWPLSRRLFTQAVRNLDNDGARVIAFDLLFTEKERSTIEDPDWKFANAVKHSGRVLLPVAFSFQGRSRELPSILSGQVYLKFDRSRHAPLFPLRPHAAVLPIPMLTGAAAGLGHVAIAFDRDGEPRYDYLALPLGGDFIPSMPMRIAAAYRNIPWRKVGLALGDGVQLGREFIPTDPAMRLVVNYRGPRGTFPTYSFADLVKGRIPADNFRNRIVLIGASFIGSSDAYAAPFGNTPIPGAERLANIVDSILSGDFVRENPPSWPGLILMLVAALAAASGLAAALLPTRLAAPAAAVPVLGWAVGTQSAFQNGLWLPFVTPIAALFAAAAAVLLFRYGYVDRERRLVQSAFRHYLAPDLVNALAAHPERLQLGGETRELTLMFCDVRGFTAISEQFKSSPQELSRLINRGFLSPMTRIIMQQRGTIDKYMGDCIMAFWNAPLDDNDHAVHACDTALAMLNELEGINIELAAEARAEGRDFYPINIGIGINTGECVVGNMGSDERFAYTAMGDVVNLASRLESQCKTYGVPVVVGEATRAAAPGRAFLELDRIAVKGKVNAVNIYTLLGDEAYAKSPDFIVLSDHHAEMLACYRERDWEGAGAALSTCRGLDTRLEKFFDLYATRIAYFTENPPPPGWNGEFVAENK